MPSRILRTKLMAKQDASKIHDAMVQAGFRNPLIFGGEKVRVYVFMEDPVSNKTARSAGKTLSVPNCKLRTLSKEEALQDYERWRSSLGDEYVVALRALFEVSDV